jgi:protein-S-isoprenylcysteine O-methyltransferase Ste14
MDTRISIFIITLICELFLGGSLVLTLVIPQFRVWPPPSRKSWQYRYTWGLTIASFVGTVVIGILDWNSFIFKHWFRYAIGSALIIVGLSFAAWSIHTLSVQTTLGLGGSLVKTGLYRYSRNPQYVSDIVALAGYAILSNSWMTMITTFLGMVWFALAPFTEEPWLRERYGDEYEKYKSEVPRFLIFKEKVDAG